jgi:succinate dehydrogenase/fumarate reductase flavoprotein subunit
MQLSLPKNTGMRSIDEKQIKEAGRQAVEPFELQQGESPFHIQYDLQAMMQELVGIVRNEDEMQRAREHLKLMRKADRKNACGREPRIQSRLAYGTGSSAFTDRI